MTNRIEANCPKEIAEVLQRLTSAGHRAYAVGGCIRDTLLGEIPNDWDVTTSALPEEVLEVFGDERTIPTGLKHGTVTVMKNRSPIEITTFRIDGAYSDSRHPEQVTFSDRISDDLSRRDFTVNALAWNKENGIVDCFDGISDLKAGVIRAVGVPEKRFEEDALRILRAYRFSARLGFAIEEKTRNALISGAPRLKNISRERISSEICRLVIAKDAYSVLKMLEADGIFPYIFDGAPYKLPSDAVLHRINELPTEFEDRLGFLLRGSSEEDIQAWLKGLRLSNRQFRDIMTLADTEAMVPTAPATEYESRKLLSSYGDLTERALHIASLHGVDTDQTAAEVARAQKNGDCVSIGALAVGGKDLIAEGIASGAALGKILSGLLELVLHDPSKNTRESLLFEAKSIADAL